MSPLRAEIRATLKLSWPLAAAFAGNQLLSLVDTVVAGHLGALEIAAVGLGNSLFFAGTILATGILTGLDTLASQALGAGESATARRHLREAVRLALWMAGPTLVAIALLVTVALWAAGVEPELRREVGSYLLTRAPAALPMLLFIALRGYLQALHKTGAVLWGTVVANLVNVPASILLAFHAGLGVAGIGLATTVMMTAQVGVLYLSLRGVPVPEGTGPPTPEGTRRLVDVGLPVGLHFGAEMGMFSLVTVLAGSLGSLAVGGHQVALQLAAFTFTVCLGVAAATAVRVGYAVGRGDSEGTLRAGLAGIGTGAVFMSTTAVAFVFLAEELASAIAKAPEVVAVAAPLLYIAAGFQIADGLQAVASGALRGAGDPRASMRITVIGHWFVGFPIGLVCTWPLGLGVRGLWLGLTAGLTFSGVALTWRFIRVAKHVRRF